MKRNDYYISSESGSFDLFSKVCLITSGAAHQKIFTNEKTTQISHALLPWRVFYLPYLKSQLNKARKNSEVCLQCLHMMYYHAVYVPLLLRLANDVEENSGPRTVNDIVDPACTVHADFNQANDLTFGINAGKQCVAMSLYAIVYKEIESVNIWDRSILNSILICGNNFYNLISPSVSKSYLLLTDVPEFVDLENHTFFLQYNDSFSGALHISENSLPYVTLEHTLNEVFFV